MFDEVQLAKVMVCSSVIGARWCTPLRQGMQRFGIITPHRAVHFLAQLGHESIGLARTEESIYYTSLNRLQEVFGHRIGSNNVSGYLRNPQALANRVYANRNGNGDIASGDGWRFRGRCPIQLTGRRNYAQIGQVLGLPLEAEPDRVLEPHVGALAAAAWWQINGLNSIADLDDVLAVSRRINLGTINSQRMPNGLADRIARTKRAKTVLAAAA